jgi:hypothetical protein
VTVLAQSPADAARYLELGAVPAQCRTVGNLKFELEVPAAARAMGHGWHEQWAGASGRFIWVAGSTHEGEEQILLAAHALLRQTLPEALLVLVPRHPPRFAAAAANILAAGLPFVARSEGGHVAAGTAVLLGDTLGELLALYAAGDVAFVGGSLVAVGGAPTRWKRLQEASIDVGFQPFPLSYVAEEAGYTNLGAIASLVPDWLFTSINVHQQWAQQNGDVLRQFLKVLRSAQNQLAAQQQALTPMLERELQTTDVFASRAMAQALRLNMFAPQLRVHEPAAQAVFDALLESDQIPRGTVFRRETFFDPSYL